MKHFKTSRPYKPNTYAFTYEGLYDMRVVRRLTNQQIANKFGCDHTTIIYACDRLGIPKRGLISPANISNPIPAPKVADAEIRFGGK